jgi:hypothetical protein
MSPSDPAAQSKPQVEEEERFLEANPDLRSFLPHLVDEVKSYLGPSEVSFSMASAETGEEELVISFSTPHAFDEASDRMRRFYSERWNDVVAPYADRVSLVVE